LPGIVAALAGKCLASLLADNMLVIRYLPIILGAKGAEDY
jgi:hypothetical protein